MSKTSLSWPIRSVFSCLLSLAAVILTCLSGSAAWATPSSDTLLETLKSEGPVSDFARLMNPDERVEILNRLKELRRKTGTQVALVTLQSLEGGHIDDFTVRLFNRWGVGEKGKNNGVMLLVAIQDHKARIEVGYGLESTLTDAQADRILKEQLFPAFKQQHYAEGLKSAVVRIAEIIEGGQTAPPQPRAAEAENTESGQTTQPQQRPAEVENVEQGATTQSPSSSVVVEQNEINRPQPNSLNVQFAPQFSPFTFICPLFFIVVVAAIVIGAFMRLAGVSGSSGGNWTGTNWSGSGFGRGWGSSGFSSGGFGGGFGSSSFGSGGFGGGCSSSSSFSSSSSSSSSSSFGGGSSGGGGASGDW